MIHIYEKVCKNEEYPYGIKEITDENPFKNPCIITLIAIPDEVKYINGSLRMVANLVNPEIDTKYNINKRILGLGYENHRNPTIEEINEFIDKYFYPIITEDNKKMEPIKVMKNLRNLTFLTYCNGARNFISIENNLIKKMKYIGYQNKDIKLILSQICLVSVTGNLMQSTGTNTTCIAFGDIYDQKYEPDYKRGLNILNSLFQKEYVYVNYQSLLGLVTKITSEGDLYRYMLNDPIITSRIKTLLNMSLDNAIENVDIENFNPLTYKKIEDVLEGNKVLKKTSKS